MSEQTKVAVRILKNVGGYTPGQVLDVHEAEAKLLCEPKCRNDGHGLVKWQNAILEEEFQKIKAAPVDHGGLTQDEARELGIRNVVVTPPDEILPERIRKVNQASFAEVKDENEGASAQVSQELNAKNKGKNK